MIYAVLGRVDTEADTPGGQLAVQIAVGGGKHVSPGFLPLQYEGAQEKYDNAHQAVCIALAIHKQWSGLNPKDRIGLQLGKGPIMMVDDSPAPGCPPWTYLDWYGLAPTAPWNVGKWTIKHWANIGLAPVGQWLAEQVSSLS